MRASSSVQAVKVRTSIQEGCYRQLKALPPPERAAYSLLPAAAWLPPSPPAAPTANRQGQRNVSEPAEQQCKASLCSTLDESCQCHSQHPQRSSRAGDAASRAPKVTVHYTHTNRQPEYICSATKLGPGQSYIGQAGWTHMLHCRPWGSVVRGEGASGGLEAQALVNSQRWSQCCLWPPAKKQWSTAKVGCHSPPHLAHPRGSPQHRKKGPSGRAGHALLRNRQGGSVHSLVDC